MLKGFTELFIFTKGERNGAIVLTILILLLIGGKSAYKYYIDHKEYDYSEVEKKIAELSVQKESIENIDHKKLEVEEVNQDRYIIDPNTATLNDLVQLGLSNKQAKVILNYRSKGGRFKKVEDLQKIYSIDESLYADIKPFIDIKKIQKIKKKSYESKKRPESKFIKKEYIPVEFSSVNLNLADTTELKSIKGIGGYYAKNIVKYRDILGGYHSFDQLYEVYGLRDRPETIELIVPYLTVSSSNIHTINVNSCTRKQLKAHPYIKWAIANSIVSIRDLHGLYKSTEGIKKSDLVDDELYSKIAPYLSIDDDN